VHMQRVKQVCRSRGDSDPGVKVLLTQRPVGAPWIAICLVLTTVRGKRHVVTPCKAVKVSQQTWGSTHVQKMLFDTSGRQAGYKA